MQLKSSKTGERLSKAFARELQAQASYRYFASAAREEGLEQVADIFLATAENEAEHARHEFEFLGGIKDIRTNLKTAISREHEESTKLYPAAAEVAEEEGFVEVADFFRNFYNPVRVGELVIVHGKIIFTSRSSVEVRIEVDTEDLFVGKKLRALTASYIMIALDTSGKAMEVPPLIVSTEEEESLFNEALARYESRKAKAGK